MTRAITGSITSHYVYDASGQRVRRIISGAETWQVFGFDGELLAEYPVASGVPSTYAQREYAYRGGDMLVVAGCDVARWLIKDQIGTPRILADVTGSLANIKRHDYLPYGEEVPVSLRSGTYGYAADCLRQDFTTYERDDETGLDYAQARYYASKQGRFISVDPDLSSAGVSDPQTWNRYAYVGNHPLVLTDPSGLKWFYNSLTNKFGWSLFNTLSEVDVAAGWGEITAATWSVQQVTGSGTIYKSNAGSLILLPTNSSKSRNLTAEVLHEVRLQNMQASKEMIEARTNAVLLEFVTRSFGGAAAVLSGGGSVTLGVVVKEVATSLVKEYVQTQLEESFDPDTWQGPIEPYNREKHYGNTPTRADRREIGGSPDHDPALVERYYDTDPSTGRPGYAMSDGERRASARDRSMMQPSTPEAQNAQGGSLSGYSRRRLRELRPGKN